MELKFIELAVDELIKGDNILNAFYKRYLFSIKPKEKIEAYKYIYTKFIEQYKFYAYEYRKILDNIKISKKVSLTA